MMTSESLRSAVAGLDLQPRERVWTSLSYCALDAVWSIGAHYDRVVVPVVRRVAADTGDSEPSIVAKRTLPADPLPISRFLERYSRSDALAAVANHQRTSTRSGNLKADAALRYARVLVEHGLTTRAEGLTALRDVDEFESADRALADVPGDGVRRCYLWMLVGDDWTVKSDRMVVRFISRYCGPTTAASARALLTQLATDLNERAAPDRIVTPWMIDHAIWRAERVRGRLEVFAGGRPTGQRRSSTTPRRRQSGRRSFTPRVEPNARPIVDSADAFTRKMNNYLLPDTGSGG